MNFMLYWNLFCGKLNKVNGKITIFSFERWMMFYDENITERLNEWRENIRLGKKMNENERVWEMG